MIELKNITKKFDDIAAVDDITLSIKERSVFGMIGTNGAGKSTVLRMITGVIKADRGEILIDSIPAYDSIEAKEKMFFIADEPYFFANANGKDMMTYYAGVYPLFNKGRFLEYLKKFDLSPDRKISTFSKGMKKQMSLLLGICAGTKYLFCDETFDGLDPVMRQGMKAIFAGEMEERGLTPVVASHNLRELEDICDYVGLLHKGGILLQRDIEDMKCAIQKIQCVFANEESREKVISSFEILKKDVRGQLTTLTLRGTRESVTEVLAGADTVFYEILPLSLEEIFISETEVVGYDIKKLILQ